MLLTEQKTKPADSPAQESEGFPGVGDHRMLHIDMTQSTWETLFALHPEEEGRIKRQQSKTVRKQQGVGLLHSTEEVG